MNQCDHIELSTDDPKKARDFYSAVFGWKIESSPMGDGGEYLMFRTGNGGGGITAKMSPQQPTAWMPYITVKSVKASLEKAVGLGAMRIPGFDYVPIGDMGAIGGFIDPTGAAIGLWEAGAAPIEAPPKKTAPKKTAPKKAAKPAAKKAAAKKAQAKKPAPKKAAKKRR
jgi:predicted enzyme related to lactoylglutathione lyase